VKKKIVAANWKMNLTHKEVRPYLDRFLAKVGEINEVQVVFIPSFTSIPAFADALEESPNLCELGAQDVDGAFVGGACLNPESFARIVQCAEKEQPTSIT
jgi:triosephosphate isomerase